MVRKPLCDPEISSRALPALLTIFTGDWFSFRVQFLKAHAKPQIHCSMKMVSHVKIYSWIGWTPSARTQKNDLPANQKDYGKSGTTYEKLSAKRIQICFDYFCKIHFWLLFQNNFPNYVWTKIVKRESDLPRQTLFCRDLRSFWDGSVWW